MFITLLLHSRRCLGWAALLFCLSAQAAETDSPAITEDLIVVAAKLPQPAYQVGRAVTVLDAADIEQLGYAYAADVFRHVPGVAVTRTGGFGGVTQLRLRGAEGNHTVVLIDGVDVSAAGTGEFDFSSLLSADIERIEVLRGGHSGIYGSNAIAGVILIQTRSAQGPFSLDVELEAGEHQSRQGAVSIAGGSDVLQGRLSLLQRRSEFDLSSDNTLGAEDDEDDNQTISGQWSAKLSDRIAVRGLGRYSERSTDTDGFDFSGGPLQGLAVDDNSSQDTQDLTLALLAQFQISDQAGLNVALEQTETETDGGFFGNEASRDQIKLDTHWQWQDSGSLSQRTTLFAQWEEEKFRNLYPFDPSQAPEQSRDLFGIGLEHALQVDAFSLTVSLRQDDNDKFEDATTYGVSGSWRFSDATRIHASYARAITNPTFFEQFGFTPSLFVGNPNLEPEESDGWDIGLTQQWHSGDLILDLTYFSAELENEIQAVFPSVQNAAGDSERDGIELALSWRVSEVAGLSASYTYTNAEEPAGDEVQRPEHMASISGYTRFWSDKLSLSGGLVYSDERLDVDFRNFFTNGFVSSRTAIDDYVTANLKLTYQANQHVQAYVRIENAFDEDYEEVISYAAPGRTVYAGVILTLN